MNTDVSGQLTAFLERLMTTIIMTLEGVVVRSFCMPIHAVLQRKCLCTAWIRTPITNKMEYTVLQNVQVKAKQTQKLQLQQNKLFKTVNLKHFF